MRSHLILIAVAAGFAAGCAPNCEQTCTKLRRCGVGPATYTQEECQTSCERQRQLYDDWGDKDKRKAFDAHRNRIGNSTCDDVLAGVCYDETIYIFDTDVI